jgi:hypothetical protein
MTLPTADGYYTCGLCGQVVTYNGTHRCAMYPVTYSWGQPVVVDEETKELLRRIANAYESDLKHEYTVTTLEVAKKIVKKRNRNL